MKDKRPFLDVFNAIKKTVEHHERSLNRDQLKEFYFYLGAQGISSTIDGLIAGDNEPFAILMINKLEEDIKKTLQRFTHNHKIDNQIIN